MSAYFPNTVWDGDSPNRDSDSGVYAAPDYCDWQQIVYEVNAIEDYFVNFERRLTVRPNMDAICQIAKAKPTQVDVSVFKGYSFPIFNNDDEQIFYETRVPFRWDGVSNILICMPIALGNTEDVGDTLKFRCSWSHVPMASGNLNHGSHDVDVEATVVSGRTAQYSIYLMHFILDYDISGVGNEVLVDDTLGFRIRRIASSGTEVDNEVILFNGVAEFQIDKLYTTESRH